RRTWGRRPTRCRRRTRCRAPASHRRVRRRRRTRAARPPRIPAGRTPTDAGYHGARRRRLVAVQTPSGHPVESSPAKRLVVLASGGGANLAALLPAHGDPSYGAGVASAVGAMKDFDDRAAWNAGVLEAISVFQPDYVVLAGFMRILAPEVVRRFEGRMINTHPALLPSFPGAHGVRDALVHGVKV